MRYSILKANLSQENYFLCNLSFIKKVIFNIKGHTTTFDIQFTEILKYIKAFITVFQKKYLNIIRFKNEYLCKIMVLFSLSI